MAGPARFYFLKKFPCEDFFTLDYGNAVYVNGEECEEQSNP